MSCCSRKGARALSLTRRALAGGMPVGSDGMRGKIIMHARCGGPGVLFYASDATCTSVTSYQPTKLTRVNVNRQACSMRRDHRGPPDAHPGRVSLIEWAGTVTRPFDANSGRWQQGAETAAASGARARTAATLWSRYTAASSMAWRGTARV